MSDAAIASLAGLVTLIFKTLWDEYVRRQQRREAREEAEVIKAKADEAVREAEMARQQLSRKIDANTAVTEQAKAAAQEAARVANNTHQMAVNLGAKRNELLDLVAKSVKENYGTTEEGEAGETLNT